MLPGSAIDTASQRGCAWKHPRSDCALPAAWRDTLSPN